MTQCLARPEGERTDAAIKENAKVYAQILYGVIPYDRLGDSYRQGMQDHTNNFALTTVDFISAWNKIKARENSGSKNSDPCLFCETSKNNPEVNECLFHK